MKKQAVKKKPTATARTKKPAKKAKPTYKKSGKTPKVQTPDEIFAALPPKQQLFVTEYLANGFNGTKAAIAAGYAKGNADTQASRMLAMTKVRAVIDARKQKMIAKREITAERVLDEIAKMAYIDPRKFFNSDGSLVPVHELGEDTAMGLAGFEARESRVDGFHVANIKKIKIADKRGSLELLGRYLKLFTDKVEHSGSLGVQLITTVPRPQRTALKK